MHPALHRRVTFILILWLLVIFASIPFLFLFLQTSRQTPKPDNLKKPVVSSPQPTHIPTATPVPELTADQLTRLLQQDVVDHDPKFALERLKKETEENDELMIQCHSFVHVIGRAAFNKYQRIDSATVFEDNFCGSGYLHGVIEARLADSSDIFTDLQSMCKPDDGNCNHGMGHGLMYYTGNDIPKSLNFCDQIKNLRGKLYCSEGVFMENFNTDQTLHPTQYLRAEDPSYPCAEQKELFKGTCYFYAPDYFLNIRQNAYVEALEWCQTIEKGYKDICIRGVGSRTMKRNINKPLFVENICMTLSDTQRKSCIEGMTSYHLVNYYSLQKTREMCATLRKENQAACEYAIEIRKDNFPD